MQRLIISIFLSMAMFATQSTYALSSEQMQSLTTAFKSEKKVAASHQEITIVYGGEDVANFPLLSMNSKILA